MRGWVQHQRSCLSIDNRYLTDIWRVPLIVLGSNTAKCSDNGEACLLLVSYWLVSTTVQLLSTGVGSISTGSCGQSGQTGVALLKPKFKCMHVAGYFFGNNDIVQFQQLLAPT
jgi:hypothetical protein